MFRHESLRTVKNPFCCLLYTVSALVAGSQLASGASISVIPSPFSVSVGQDLTITLGISGLGNDVAPSLGAFDLTLNYNPTLYSFNSAVFGGPILGDELDLSGSGTVSSVTPGSGTVELTDVSLADSTTLENLQPGIFALARLSFAALSPGLGAFTLSNITLSDEFGNPLTLDRSGFALVTVSAPEPATFVPVLLGLCGLAYGYRRKRLKALRS